jgi:hypothetical protein
MKSTPTHFPLKAGALLGFLAMAVVGWNLAGGPVPTMTESVNPEAKTRRADRATGRSKPTGPGTLAGKHLDSIRSAGSPEARLSATIALANSLSPSEIAAWLNGGWFNIRGGPEHLLFRNILLARWRETDPEGLLVWSLKNDTSASQAVIASWSEKEPQRLIEFFKNHPDETAELRSLQAIAKSHPALALQRLQEMADAGMSRQGVGNSSGLLRQLAANFPAALEAVLDSLPAQLKNQAESALCGQRLIASFSTEIRALWDRPDGWKLFQSNLSEDALRGKMFDELANLPPAWRTSVADNYYYFARGKDTTKWLDADLEGYGFTAGQAKKLRTHALINLALEQPEDALKRINEVVLNTDSRQDFISNMVSSLKNDPERLAALIARLGTEEDRKHARESMESGDQKPDDPKVVKPAEWLKKISAIDPKALANSVEYLHLIGQWDAEKLAELSQQFAVMPDDKKQQAAQVIVAARRYSHSSSPVSGEAIRYLLGNPVTRPEGENNSETDPVRMASDYASNLVVRDPAAARAWVDSLPAGDAKLWAQKNVTKNWAVYDPKSAEQWAASLPVDVRTEVKKFMENMK